tara:strand:+ start:1279 stop:1620 length:342 start_codon:yes stop_codon:yes gene_type:complete
MIEEIDNYTHEDHDNVVIDKNNFTHVDCIDSEENKKIFKFKDEIIFILDINSYHSASTSFYEKDIYKKLLDGTLDMLILNKLDEPILLDSYRVNYKIESYENYSLRRTYKKIN